MRNLAEDRSIIIKPGDKGSYVVVWDREDYLAEGYRQLSDENVYGEVLDFKEDFFTGLVRKSDNLFRRLNKKGVLTDKELKYFLYEFKNSACLGKMYLLPKIHKKMHNVSGLPVI